MNRRDILKTLAAGAVGIGLEGSTTSSSKISSGSSEPVYLFQIAQIAYPDLAVVDAFTSLEGDGPIDGTPVDTRLALASTGALALDSLGTKIMGFDPTQILYLSSMNEAGMGQGDLDKINVIGANLNECLFKFKPHSSLVEPYGLGKT